MSNPTTNTDAAARAALVAELAEKAAPMRRAAALIAADGKRLAELEAMEKRTKEQYERVRFSSLASSFPVFNALVYILTGKETMTDD